MFGKIFGRNKDTKTDKVDVNKEVVDSPLTQEITPTSFGNASTFDSKEMVQDLSSDSKSINEESNKATEIPPLTFKEMKALKRSRYEDTIMNNPKFKKTYVLQNIKTGQMAEIRAASSFHACNIIGWKANRVRLISEKVIEEKVPEATGSSTVPS